jgi:putative peptide-modifying radical SAM enzyme
MHYHLILTDQCNSQCRYCYQKSVLDADSHHTFTYNFSAPSRFHVDVETLREFLEKDETPVLIFYGGEPLLEIETMKKIMDTISVPFRMQTNGLLLHKLPPQYVAIIEKILISLDGTRERTNYNRGKDTYQKVMKNISSIASWYPGEIIARMTVAQDCPDICEQVLSLVADGFTSVHWQIDAGFYRCDFDEPKFSQFVNHYNKSVSTLITYWIDQAARGNILRLYPFIGIVSSLLKKEQTLLRCGAGHAGYAITTDGKLVACPLMNYVEDFVAGTVTTHPAALKKFSVSGRCLHCDIAHVCGGRCLYWNKARSWPEEGDNLICTTVEHLVRELEDRIPEIEELIVKDILKQEDFDYEKYFGPEIIP